MVNKVCAGDSLERIIILGSTNSIAYAHFHPLFFRAAIKLFPHELLHTIGLTYLTTIRYAFNAWIPLLSYNTEYAPRFLVGNSITVGLIICAAMTLILAVYLERRDNS